jgi:hypothetical protein
MLDPAARRAWRPTFYVEDRGPYVKMALGDVLVRAEHGPDPGPVVFSFVQLVEDGWMDLTVRVLEPELLEELAAAMTEAGWPSVARDLRRAANLSYREPPEGW